jgi:hypothetical protein
MRPSTQQIFQLLHLDLYLRRHVSVNKDVNVITEIFVVLTVA